MVMPSIPKAGTPVPRLETSFWPVKEIAIFTSCISHTHTLAGRVYYDGLRGDTRVAYGLVPADPR